MYSRDGGEHRAGERGREARRVKEEQKKSLAEFMHRWLAGSRAASFSLSLSLSLSRSFALSLGLDLFGCKIGQRCDVYP